MVRYEGSSVGCSLVLRAGAWILPALGEFHESSTMASLKVWGSSWAQLNVRRCPRNGSSSTLLLRVSLKLGLQGQWLCLLTAVLCRLSAEAGWFSSLECWLWLIHWNFTGTKSHSLWRSALIQSGKNAWCDFLQNKEIQKQSIIWQSTIHRMGCKAVKSLWWSAILTCMLFYFIKALPESCEGGWGKSASLMSHNSGNCMKVCVIWAVV